MYMFLYTCIHICVYKRACISTYMVIDMYVYMHVYVYI